MSLEFFQTIVILVTFCLISITEAAVLQTPSFQFDYTLAAGNQVRLSLMRQSAAQAPAKQIELRFFRLSSALYLNDSLNPRRNQFNAKQINRIVTYTNRIFSPIGIQFTSRVINMKIADLNQWSSISNVLRREQQTGSGKEALVKILSDNQASPQTGVNVFLGYIIESTAGQKRPSGVAFIPYDTRYAETDPSASLMIDPDAAPENFPSIFVHELGHYFGLLHAFQYVCAGTWTEDTLGGYKFNYGDGVEDTPYSDMLLDGDKCYSEEAPFKISTPDCVALNGGVVIDSPRDNLMAYYMCNENRTFTYGQYMRMSTTIMNLKPGLNVSWTGNEYCSLFRLECGNYKIRNVSFSCGKCGSGLKCTDGINKLISGAAGRCVPK